MRKAEKIAFYKELSRIILKFRNSPSFSKEEAKQGTLAMAGWIAGTQENLLQLAPGREVEKKFDKLWKAKERNFADTELGHGEKFVDHYIEELRYCIEKKSWFVWDGKRWKEDSTKEKILFYAKKMIREEQKKAKRMLDGSMEDDSKDKRDPDYWQKQLDTWKSYESVPKLKGLITSAQIGDKKVLVSPEDLDQKLMLFNCQNGTIDLRTGELWEHDPEELLTKIAAVKYSENAKCPRWEDFLYEVTGRSRDTVNYLRRVLGYVLTGRIDEKALFFLYGPTDSGKTTFIETIRELTGDYGKGTDFSTFLTAKWGKGIRNDIARLESARFVSASEAGPDQKFDQAVVKYITGKDTIVSRFLYKEFTEFTPQFKVFLAANDMPKVVGMDEAFWNRIHVIRFHRIAKKRQDKTLSDKLRRELKGILRWAVKGCLEYQEIGLKPSAEVMEELKIYKASADVVERFIYERCRVDEKSYCAFGKLFKAWEIWCRERGVDAGSEKAFAMILNKKGFTVKTMGVDGKSTRMRKGITLRFPRKEREKIRMRIE